MAMGAMRTIPHAAVRAIRQLGPSSRASTSKWTIESDIALEVEEKRRQEAQAHSHVHAGGGPRRRHWSHHRAAAGSSSPARSMSMSMPTTMSMHTSARRASPSNDRGVPEDRLVQYAESPPAYITIKDLAQYGTTPLSDESLIASAEFTRLELPHRLARRVLAHRSLPFIVGRNPYIAQVYQLYESSFATLSAVPPIQSLEDNVRFSKTLDQLVADHAENVPTLAKGFSECKPYLEEADIATFFDRAIRNRIGIRLIAEQHLSLTFDSSPEATSKRDQRRAKQKGQPVAGEDRFIGIVDTQCRLDKIVKGCGYHVESLCEGAYGKSPDLIIDGDTAATFSYVPTHIEYVLTELLKNAFRATCDAHPDVSHANLPPVRVTISTTSPSATGENRSWPPVVTIRVRDAGGGIPPEILPKVHSYAFTTVSPGAGGEEGNPDVSSAADDEGPGPYGMQNVGGGVGLDDTMQGMQSSTGHLAGLGFGLPLSRLHCEYFGGSLELVSLYGLGTDAFMVLRGERAA